MEFILFLEFLLTTESLFRKHFRLIACIVEYYRSLFSYYVFLARSIAYGYYIIAVGNLFYLCLRYFSKLVRHKAACLQSSTFRASVGAV